MEMRQSRHPGAWLTTLGLCVAMEVILARFLSLHTWNLKIGFSFLPVVAAAYWGGPPGRGPDRPFGGPDWGPAVSGGHVFSRVYPDGLFGWGCVRTVFPKENRPQGNSRGGGYGAAGAEPGLKYLLAEPAVSGALENFIVAALVSMFWRAGGEGAGTAPCPACNGKRIGASVCLTPNPFLRLAIKKILRNTVHAPTTFT